MFNESDARFAAYILGIKFDKYTVEEFLTGINIELEHGCVNKRTNVTNDDLIKTAKIALAHLEEYPNYYHLEYGLSAFENFLREKLQKNK